MLLKASKASQNDLGTVLSTDVKKKGILGFYEHVIGIYDEHRVSENVIIFARLALNSISEKERKKHIDTVKTLWKMIFSNSLETLQFEEAYTALISIPDIEMRRYCLHRFVTVVCENGHVEALCTRYIFADLQSEVEETLLFKAKTRNVVPLPSPTDHNPNYHQYLYSYYIFRGEYRNASFIMYDYARRLGCVAALDIGGRSLVSVITEQARAYLASINALTLVDSDFSYLVYSSDPLDASGLRVRLYFVSTAKHYY
jgi:nuclear pore complex protein Nup160